MRKTLQILAEKPCIANWWDKQEKAFSLMPAGHVREEVHYFHHANRSTEQLVKMVDGDLFYRIMNAPPTAQVDYELTCHCGS